MRVSLLVNSQINWPFLLISSKEIVLFFTTSPYTGQVCRGTSGVPRKILSPYFFLLYHIYADYMLSIIPLGI